MDLKKLVQLNLLGEPIKPTQEVRWYKGLWRVKVIAKSPKNWGVEALEDISSKGGHYKHRDIEAGEIFTTPRRLLWRRPRNV